MYPARLNADGALQDVYRPAIYLDTNFLRHYYLAEGAEDFVDDEGREIEPPWASDFPRVEPSPDARTQMLWKMIRKRDTATDFALIRHYAINCLTEASLILTPIAVLELFKLHAEVAYKEICAEAVGVKWVQRWGDRAVGEHLTEIFNRSVAEDKDDTAREIKQDCTFNLSFAMAHGLQGTFYVNDLRFRLTDADVARILWVPSFLQLETTDVLHLHAAHLLRCDYFASLDSGFSRNRQLIESFAGFKLLCSVKEVMDVMKKHRKKRAQPSPAGDDLKPAPEE